MGPRSVVKTEKVNESIFQDACHISHIENISLSIPDGVLDLEKWMMDLMHDCGYKDWYEAERDLQLPQKTMLLFPAQLESVLPIEKKLMLRTALILSKSNTNRYWPNSPMICTQNRLNRSVRMIEINTNEYYGLDEE